MDNMFLHFIQALEAIRLLFVPNVIASRVKNSDIARMKSTLGTIGILEREFRLRSRICQSAVVSIHEFKASKVCNFCKETSLKATKLPNDKYTHSIIDCKNCRQL
ncbi:hypothetical protein BD408DRAFT_426542 [Parasitella parasitica]|nr:hypothetical protein BD408DRAFT_426542 [Parasitella parasitica]